MRILDRYILKSVFNILLCCLFTFVFLYVIIDLFANLDVILKQHIAFSLLAQYYLANLPIIFVQVVPIACLLATLYTFAKLNRDNEIIAMRSSGLSIIQLTKPLIVLGILVSALVFWINDTYVPSSALVTQNIKEQMDSGIQKAKEKGPEIIKNFSMFASKNRLFYANVFSPSTNTMENIIVLEQNNNQDIVKKIVASKGIFKDGVWRFYHCITYEFDQNGQMAKEPQYLDEEVMDITETPDEFVGQRQRSDYMNINQLNNYIWKLSKSGATPVIRSLKVDLYQRFTMPLTSIIIILLGIPFALMMIKRATGLSSLGISMVLGFLYYVLNAISIALGKKGMIEPIIAVLLSHALALFLSIYMLRTIP
ncbi:MAG: LptF/LptG family permease [Candidatus Omnitrophica bacterium]|nr:LptF/LptG family permease [Candidatus Omnitrophota bacterium]